LSPRSAIADSTKHPQGKHPQGEYPQGKHCGIIIAEKRLLVGCCGWAIVGKLLQEIGLVGPRTNSRTGIGANMDILYCP
jgi:hypothetical protein